MTNFRTKDQGILGESQVLAKFVSLGIPVSIPFGDNCSYDLIAEFNGKLNKIQVKTSIQTAEGKTVFELSRKRINTSNTYIKAYDSNEIDYFALYSVVRNKIYLIPIEEAPSKAISIRFEPTKNNQPILHSEEKYLIDNFNFE